MSSITFTGITTEEAVRIAVAAVEVAGTFVLENMEVKE